MRIMISGQTDVGIIKSQNNDSFYASSAETFYGTVAFGVVCDGLDGLQCGNVASVSVTKKFKEWYRNDLSRLLQKGFQRDELIKQWNQIMQSQNQLIQAYGKENNLTIGTTVTAVLVCQKQYYVMHVGDSRAYRIGSNAVQITNDQTVSAEEMRKGNITKEQARVDRRRNILLQCVGVSNRLKPEFYYGTITEDTTFLLCSNGFTRQMKKSDLRHYFAPGDLKTKEAMESVLWRTTLMVKMQKEKDSITTVLIKVEI